MNFSTKVFSVFKRDVFLLLTDLVTSIVIARTLGPVAMGLYALLQMLPSYAEVLGRIKFDQSAVYLLGKKLYAVEEVVFTLNALSLVSSAAILTIILGAKDWIFAGLFKSHLEIHGLATLMLAVVPMNFLYLNYSYLHIQRENVRDYNHMVLIKACIYSSLSLLFLLVFKWDLAGVVYANLIAVLCGLIFGAAKFHRNHHMKPVFNRALICDLFKYGSTLYASGLISSLNQYCTNFIVALKLNPAQISFFNMARARADLLNKVPNAMSLILYPRISNTSSVDDSTQLAARAYRVIWIILTTLSCLALLTVKPLIYFLYGESFLPAVTPLLILLPGIVFAGAGSTIVDYLVGTGRARFMVWISLVPLILQICLSLTLIPQWGISGAALSLSLSLVVTSLIQVFVFCRITAQPAKAVFFPRREDFATVKKFVLSRLKLARASR